VRELRVSSAGKIVCELLEPLAIFPIFERSTTHRRSGKLHALCEQFPGSHSHPPAFCDAPSPFLAPNCAQTRMDAGCIVCMFVFATMKELMLRATLVLCTFLLLGIAHAFGENYRDGNYLLGSCGIGVRHYDNKNDVEDKSETWRDGTCVGFVSAVVDVSPKVCAPVGSTTIQDVRVVVKFLQDHPEQLNLRDTDLIEKALSQAFPCKK
jgi:hypothetical protein